MDDNTIEIRDDAINVQEIMEQIRDKIQRRQAAGELPPDPDTLISPLFHVGISKHFNESTQNDLTYINSHWDIHNKSYFISSHHPYIGKFLIKGRQLVHGEVRRYVDPMISHQMEFNASTVRIIARTSQQTAELNQCQKELETAFSSFQLESDRKIVDSITTAKSELDSKIELTAKELKNAISELDSKIDLTIKELFTQIRVDINAKTRLVHVLEDRVQKRWEQKSTSRVSNSNENTNYYFFKERFRGSREDIKQRQLTFLPYFEHSSRVLDIGCGRGEFLELLQDHGIGGIGVDLDADMVSYCESCQLDVMQSDAIKYLEKLEDKSLDGIFIDQVVEHLELEYFIRLLALCYQKLKYGYYIVVKTVNPLSFVSFVNFYIDLPNKRLIHPETLQFLMNDAGFRESEKKFFSPVSDEGRLKKITDISELEETVRTNVDVYNHNIEIFNTVLFGAQDYAVIGKKR